MLVVTGAGEAFCAGWDLADAAVTTMGDWDEFRTHVQNSPGDCGYTRRVDVFKPVIAAVNGWAVAAGLETALLADIRFERQAAMDCVRHQRQSRDRRKSGSTSGPRRA